MSRFHKKWKTISLATLLALGGASLIGDYRSVHASINTAPKTQHITHASTPKQITPQTKIQVSSPVLHQLASTKKSISRLAQKQQADRAKFTYVSADNQYTESKQQPKQVPTVVRDLTDALNRNTAKINKLAKQHRVWQARQKNTNNKKKKKLHSINHTKIHNLSNQLIRSEQHINQEIQLSHK